jgi:hypothetical protein
LCGDYGVGLDFDFGHRRRQEENKSDLSLRFGTATVRNTTYHIPW